jgi:hypothetical protein
MHHFAFTADYLVVWHSQWDTHMFSATSNAQGRAWHRQSHTIWFDAFEHPDEIWATTLHAVMQGRRSLVEHKRQ